MHFDFKQEVGELLREWKKDNEAMLARFDTNQDGEIDMQEWEHARRTAEVEITEVREQHADAPPVDVLAQSRNRRNPFILATRTEEEMLKVFHWYAGKCIQRRRPRFNRDFMGYYLTSFSITVNN